MSNKKFKRYTVTAALPYANGPIHIGHLAGVYVPADIYVRFKRLEGEDIHFVCGSDEHGVPVTIRAEKEGLTVQEVVDKYHAMIKKSLAEFGISFDNYSRTSLKIHHETSSEFFLNLHNKGIFVELESDQYYDTVKNRFLADRYIRGTCPVCGNPDAYGDQCERCGSSLSPTDLIHPRSAISDSQPVMKPTKHWYLPLDKYQSFLEQWIEGHKEDWKVNVYGQCMSWITQGLQPRSMTRDLDWGIPVPLPQAEGKVLYVWFDAPIGYISSSKEYFASIGKEKDWEIYWKDKESKLLHFIGKDNIVFHCLIFPLMLHLHGEYVLPDNVPANEFLNLENDKISTSRNWAVWLHEYLEEFPDKQDVLRYYLTVIAPETKDNDFTWKDFQAKNNNELVATLGNFVNRALVLIHKYFDGKVPTPAEIQETDQHLIDELRSFPKKIADSIDQYRFREALALYMDLARLGNKYMQDTEPWQLYKNWEQNHGRIATILHLSLQVVANLALLGEPFLPFSARKIAQMLQLDKWEWQKAGGIEILKSGQILNQPELLFEKIEDESIQKQIQKLNKSKEMNEQSVQRVKALKEEISYEDFAKMDIRIATILEAEKVPKTTKLLKLKLDTGLDQRIVVSGIAEHFSPEEIIGKQVCLLANLAPRNLKGIESQGMILMAENAEGKLVFVSPAHSIANGGTVQ